MDHMRAFEMKRTTRAVSDFSVDLFEGVAERGWRGGLNTFNTKHAQVLKLFLRLNEKVPDFFLHFLLTAFLLAFLVNG
jgi:hypothetical protein